MMWERALRLWSGLVVAVYVIIHLLNHTLGLLSLEAMEIGLRWILPLWSNPLGTFLLYGALLLHYLLSLHALYRRSHLRISPGRPHNWGWGY